MDRSAILTRIREQVETLTTSGIPEYEYIPLHPKPSPSVKAVCEIMKLLRKIIFPGFFGSAREAQPDSIQYYTGVYLEKLVDLLQEQIDNSLCFEEDTKCDTHEKATGLAVAFLDQVPELKRLLATDVKAMMDGDPAAKSHSEVIFSYPSITAMLHQRTAHILYRLNVPVLPRIITEIAHSETGIDIHPGAQIGEYFGMDHGTGIVIGGTVIIGNHVRLYQGVTLGAKNFSYDEAGLPMDIPRHPIIEDHVTIYSNASVLGRITIGEGSVIGGNIWLTHDVPPFSRILQRKAVQEDK